MTTNDGKDRAGADVKARTQTSITTMVRESHLQQSVSHLRRVLDFLQEKTSLDIRVSRNGAPDEDQQSGVFVSVSPGAISGSMACWAFLINDGAAQPMKVAIEDGRLPTLESFRDFGAEILNVQLAIDAVNMRSYLMDLAEQKRSLGIFDCLVD